MKKRLIYRDFKKFLLKDGYTESEIVHLFKSIKKTDADTRRQITDWFNGDGFPEDIVENITVNFLVTEYGMKPINAFLTIDWLKHNPQSAKYFMLKNNPEIQISDNLQKEMEDIMKPYGQLKEENDVPNENEEI